MPKDYLDKGDPYYCQCVETARLLRARLGSTRASCMLTFQSRFGRAEWLQPYTDMTVKALAERGVKNLAVDHAGLLRRLPGDAGGDRGRERARSFDMHGGENFAAIPCLNDSEAGMPVICARRAARAEGLDLST